MIEFLRVWKIIEKQKREISSLLNMIVKCLEISRVQGVRLVLICRLADIYKYKYKKEKFIKK